LSLPGVIALVVAILVAAVIASAGLRLLAGFVSARRRRRTAADDSDAET
jgi:hypothetical protein